MDLREYLFYNRISITAFSKTLGVSRNYLNQLVLGNLLPSKILAQMIEIRTKGQVTYKDLKKLFDTRNK